MLPLELRSSCRAVEENFVTEKSNTKLQVMTGRPKDELPWRSGGQASACPMQGPWFNPWSENQIPLAATKSLNATAKDPACSKGTGEHSSCG